MSDACCLYCGEKIDSFMEGGRLEDNLCNGCKTIKDVLSQKRSQTDKKISELEKHVQRLIGEGLTDEEKCKSYINLHFMPEEKYELPWIYTCHYCGKEHEHNKAYPCVCQFRFCGPDHADKFIHQHPRKIIEDLITLNKDLFEKFDAHDKRGKPLTEGEGDYIDINHHNRIFNSGMAAGYAVVGRFLNELIKKWKEKKEE